MYGFQITVFAANSGTGDPKVESLSASLEKENQERETREEQRVALEDQVWRAQQEAESAERRSERWKQICQEREEALEQRSRELVQSQVLADTAQRSAMELQAKLVRPPPCC